MASLTIVERKLIGLRMIFRGSSKWLVSMIVVYIVFMSIVVLLRYYSFQTNAFDLGIFSQSFWTALKGHLFFETPDQHVITSGSFLGTHFNLLMFLLLPIYAGFPSPATLLILQTLVISLGAVPVFLIGQRVIGSSRLALAMAVVYLVNPATLTLNIYDFHLEAFLPFFVGMFFYCFLEEKWKGYALFLFLSLVTIDIASLLVIAVCLTHMLRSVTIARKPALRLELQMDHRRKVILAATALVSAVSFYLILYLSLVVAGESASVQGVLTGFLSSSGFSGAVIAKSEFWVLPLVTLMFLPLLAPRELLMVAPWFAVTILDTGATNNYSLGYQFAGAFVAPFLILGAIYAIGRLHKRRINATGIIAGIFVFSLLLSPFSPVAQGRISGIAYNEPFPTVTSHDEILDATIGLIPSNASVLTQNNLFPQVSQRFDAFVYLTNNTKVDFILADTTSVWYSQLIWGTQSMKQWVPYFISTGRYGVVVNDDGVLLLEAGYSGPIVYSGGTTYTYNYQSLYLYSGVREQDPTSQSGVVLLHEPSEESGVTFWYGPYASLPPGEYNVVFYVKSSANATGSLTLDVSNSLNATSSPTIVERTINQSSFAVPDVWTPFSLTFTYTPLDSSIGKLEFRGVSVEGGPFELDYIEVTYLGPPSG